MFSTSIDATAFIAGLSDLEKRQLPFAIAGAINDSLFIARDAWRTNIATVFDNPAAITLDAVLYKKATKESLTGELFLRNEATKGTPPSRYLLPQVRGGGRQEKPFEYLLREAGVLGPNEYAIPAKGYPLNAQGNIPGGIFTAILSDMQAQRDVRANSTAESRKKRGRRKAIGKRQVYFYNRAKRGNLLRGIYERTNLALGNSIRMVLAIVDKPPTYSSRFHAFEIANQAFASSFPVRFRVRLAEAVATAKLK